MKKLFLSKYFYLSSILLVGVISVFLLIPNTISITTSGQKREIALVPPFISKYFYIWGRKIVLKPDFQVAIEYQQGKLIAFEKKELDELESGGNLNFEDLAVASKIIQQRIEYFSSTPARVHVIDENEKSFLVVETMPTLDEQVIEILSTTPANLEFFLQKEEADNEKMIFSEDWDQGFESMGIGNGEIASAKSQLDFQTNRPIIVLTLTDQARKNLFRISRENKGKMLMISVDGSILLLSPINEPIHNGKITIAGGNSLEQAKVLSSMLSISPLPFSLIRSEGDFQNAFDLGVNSNRDSVGIFGLSRLESHLLIMGFVILLSLILISVVFFKEGLIASTMILIGILFSVVLLRLFGKVISYELLVAFGMIVGWWLMITVFLLLEHKCLKKRGESSSMKTIFLIKRKIIKKSISLLLLSSLIVSALAKNFIIKSITLSLEFSQSFIFLSFLSVSIFLFYILIIKKVNEAIDYKD